MDHLPDVGVSGTGARIHAGHASVADRGEKHGDHGHQNRGDHVAAGYFLTTPKSGMGAVG